MNTNPWSDKPARSLLEFYLRLLVAMVAITIPVTAMCGLILWLS